MTFRLLCAHSAVTGCDARDKAVTAVMIDTCACLMRKQESSSLRHHGNLPDPCHPFHTCGYGTQSAYQQEPAKAGK